MSPAQNLRTVLIVGAAEGSLGEAIHNAVNAVKGLRAVSVGLHNFAAGPESSHMDITDDQSITDTMRTVDPHHVIITTGVNRGARMLDDHYAEHMRKSFEVNTIGPMVALQKFIVNAVRLHPIRNEKDPMSHFVVISSNSAHIARTGSAPYCSTKAALSMALRVAGRETASADWLAVYGYEPGLIAGTPMTADVRTRLGDHVALHRMPGIVDGLDKIDVARVVASNLIQDGRIFNGTMHRLDAGEQ